MPASAIEQGTPGGHVFCRGRFARAGGLSLLRSDDCAP